eukprot:UN17512
MFFTILPQRKWFLEAFHTEKLMVYRDLPHGKWILEVATRNLGFRGCHKEMVSRGFPH